MKKITAIFLSVLILASDVLMVFASNPDNRVFAENVTVEVGDQVTIPVKIENNKGFMGFAIIVTYDAGCLTPVSVSMGSMLTGMFNDSIATSTDNSFKVVFTGTGNIVADGELFKITFNVSDEDCATYGVELSYLQADTFKEDWSDAVFNCESAEIVVTVNGTTAPTTTQSAPSTESITKKEEPSMEPDVEETITQLVAESEDEPFSLRMREWVNRLPFSLKIILGIFVIPVALIISIVE